MNVVDSSAWLSYFAGDHNSAQFAELIEAIDKLLVPTLTVIEVYKSVVRQKNKELALEAIAHMAQGDVIALDWELALDCRYIWHRVEATISRQHLLCDRPAILGHRVDAGCRLR